MEYKIGDRVKAIKPYDDNDSIVGKVGTVIYIWGNSTGYITVHFDEPIERGHGITIRGDSNFTAELEREIREKYSSNNWDFAVSAGVLEFLNPIAPKEMIPQLADITKKFKIGLTYIKNATPLMEGFINTLDNMEETIKSKYERLLKEALDSRDKRIAELQVQMGSVMNMPMNTDALVLNGLFLQRDKDFFYIVKKSAVKVEYYKRNSWLLMKKIPDKYNCVLDGYLALRLTKDLKPHSFFMLREEKGKLVPLQSFHTSSSGSVCTGDLTSRLFNGVSMEDIKSLLKAFKQVEENILNTVNLDSVYGFGGAHATKEVNELGSFLLQQRRDSHGD
jgi:hypothetical protein